MESHMLLLIKVLLFKDCKYLIIQNPQFSDSNIHLIINFQVLNHDALFLIYANIQFHSQFIKKICKILIKKVFHDRQYNRIVHHWKHIPLLNRSNLTFLISFESI